MKNLVSIDNKLTIYMNYRMVFIFIQQIIYHVIYSTTLHDKWSTQKSAFLYVQKKISPVQLYNPLIQHGSIFRFYQGTKYVIF